MLEVWTFDEKLVASYSSSSSSIQSASDIFTSILIPDIFIVVFSRELYFPNLIINLCSLS